MKENIFSIPIAIVIAGIIISGSIIYKRQEVNNQQPTETAEEEILSEIEKEVFPPEGVTLPISWGDLGVKLVGVGAIDKEKFVSLYKNREQFTEEYEKLLSTDNKENLKITENNSGYLLNLFWALGLANENEILTKGEMSDPQYGGAERFASTGGWTMSKGDAMLHYSRHPLIVLSSEQQALVEKVSKNIYRPCCGNSTHFPDCNHGMAMLGFLELMASQGVSEDNMYKAALAVNSYWFPDTYLTIAEYLKNKGIEWKNVTPKEILGAEYSSILGYRNIVSQMSQSQTQSKTGSSGCGVDAGVPAQQKQQSGCGI